MPIKSSLHYYTITSLCWWYKAGQVHWFVSFYLNSEHVSADTDKLDMEIFIPLSSFLVLMSLSTLLPQIAILGYQRWFQTCSLFITVRCHHHHHHLFLYSLTPKLLQKKKTPYLYFLDNQIAGHVLFPPL